MPPDAPGATLGRVVCLTLPLPPTTNRATRVVNNRAVKSREARDYADMVCRACMVYGYSSGGRDIPPGDLEMRIALFLKRDRDVDSCKVLQDCVALSLGFNDAKIRHLVITKHVDRANPRAEVTLSAYEEPDHAND